MSGFCRYNSLLNLAVQGWDTALIGEAVLPHPKQQLSFFSSHGVAHFKN